MSRKLNWNVTVLATLVIVIVCISVALLAILLLDSAKRLDDQQLASEKRIVTSVVKRQLAKVETQVTDYGAWDDMYDRFAGTPDPQWDDENLGNYASTTFQLSRILVFSRAGRAEYSYDAQSRGPKPVRAEDLAFLKELSANSIDEQRAGVLRATTGIVAYEGRPHFIGVHAISVASEKRKETGAKSNHALIYLKTIDEPYLQAVSNDFGIHGLRVGLPSLGMIPLGAPRKERSLYSLSWSPSSNGSQFISDSLPLLLVAAPVVAVLLVVLVFGWLEIADHARNGELRLVEARATAAEETSRAKSLFIANMSHELRTPLNAIIGFSEFIRMDVSKLGVADKYREYVGDIFTSGEHLLRIVNNLLLYSKIEANQHHPHIVSLCLADELAATMRMLTVIAEKAQVHLVFPEVPKSVDVMTDQQSFAQIVVNVVSNAIKFSSPNGEVRVEFRTKPGICELRVIDHGCGIPPDTLALLGAPFVQAEGVYSRRQQGTGLGLAICFALAEQIHSGFTVASTEGVGTTVTVTLPLASEAAPSVYETLASKAAPSVYETLAAAS